MNNFVYAMDYSGMNDNWQWIKNHFDSKVFKIFFHKQNYKLQMQQTKKNDILGRVVHYFSTMNNMSKDYKKKH